MDNWRVAFREGVESLALTVTAEQEDRFARFLALLLDYNQRINLTAITDPAEVAVEAFRRFADRAYRLASATG